MRGNRERLRLKVIIHDPMDLELLDLLRFRLNTEIETAIQRDIPFVTVVNDNWSLNQTRGGVERAYEGGPGDPDPIWKFTDTDFAAVAQEFGAVGILVTDPNELGDAITRAFDSGKPVIIDAKSDPAAMAPLPWAPGK